VNYTMMHGSTNINSLFVLRITCVIYTVCGLFADGLKEILICIFIFAVCNIHNSVTPAGI